MFGDNFRTHLIVVFRLPIKWCKNPQSITQQLNNILVKLEKENKKVYIMGDLNIDGMKVAYNKQVSSFFNMLMEKDLIPLITKPTRVQDLSISLIDHAIVNTNAIKDQVHIKIA